MPLQFKSKTTTSSPRESSFRTNASPKYPAPPVTTLLLKLLFLFSQRP
jgi:hypothetical protein